MKPLNAYIDPSDPLWGYLASSSAETIHTGDRQLTQIMMAGSVIVSGQEYGTGELLLAVDENRSVILSSGPCFITIHNVGGDWHGWWNQGDGTGDLIHSLGTLDRKGSGWSSDSVEISFGRPIVSDRLPATLQPEKRNWLPIALVAGAVAIMIGLVVGVWAIRGTNPANNSSASQNAEASQAFRGDETKAKQPSDTVFPGGTSGTLECSLPEIGKFLIYWKADGSDGSLTANGKRVGGRIYGDFDPNSNQIFYQISDARLVSGSPKKYSVSDSGDLSGSNGQIGKCENFNMYSKQREPIPDTQRDHLNVTVRYPERIRLNMTKSCQDSYAVEFQKSAGFSDKTNASSIYCGCFLEKIERNIPIMDFLLFDKALAENNVPKGSPVKAEIDSYDEECRRNAVQAYVD